MGISLIADSISAVAFSKLTTPQISAAVAPPPRKSNHLRTARRILLRRRRRTRRRSDSGGEDAGFFSDGGDGGGFYGGGGRGWSSGGGSFGWSNWEWDGAPSPDDPAFDFVYEVVSWVALSNCLHFAFKKVVRIGGDPEREKLRLAPIC